MVQLEFTRPQSELATVEELVQMMNTVARATTCLEQEISRLTAENQQFRQAGSPGLAEIAATVGQAVQTAISNANRRSNDRQSLVDIKGQGILPLFTGEYHPTKEEAKQHHPTGDRETAAPPKSRRWECSTTHEEDGGSPYQLN